MTTPQAVPPLVRFPDTAIFRHALELPTPALVYDLKGLRHSVGLLVADVATVAGAQLNVALKACHTVGVLSELAALGLGADVASLGEYNLARAAGFTRITATGPAFTIADAEKLRADGVLVDASSYEQLEALCAAFPGEPVGVRLRVPLPEAIENEHSTFGAQSRFGLLATDPRLHDLLGRTGNPLVRLHTHTGQMTAEHLVHKTRYLLAVAEAFPDLHTIDLGGGFFSLYAQRSAALGALAAVDRILRQWCERTGRAMTLQFEPGGGVLGPHGYLFVSVLSSERDHPAFGADVVTVDASAWNYAPWHRPVVLPADPDATPGEGRATLLAGNTLYENDFFGTDVRGRRSTFDLAPCTPGDRLVLTASGAYTSTNKRWFNRIEPPAEWAYDGTGIRPVS
ncbi:diaminopimelate decarboxylase family protein [Actinoplanes friuliensis]|uniref:Pyridoxal dependent decarboxylase n=1 Tax=Actinoplanes friuliensis DSM 7358 TaxID=1246995 RepID=U5W1Z6_9ACTN|nr:pyridoxal-dependent decarboxylase [Actinoplanes friuliensis]AGZ41951.1 Pyridoxal dependent decarboxylase [Actinoplanes friuliensis DSM 7358]